MPRHTDHAQSPPIPDRSYKGSPSGSPGSRELCAGLLRILVVDDGKVDRVTRATSRSLQARTMAGNPTGIRLSIVPKTFENRGGRVWLESDGSTGTPFYFTA